MENKETPSATQEESTSAKVKPTFPPMKEWIKRAVFPNEMARIGRPKYYKYYKEKFDVCSSIEVGNIAEIGVRYGYGAFSFMCAHPEASYTGFDLINGGHGGVKGGFDTFIFVREMLERNFPKAEIKLNHENTWILKTLGGPYDFIHVDGNHRRTNCLHDMEIAFYACTSGGIIFIDDYKYIPSVKLGVHDFIDLHEEGIKNVEIRDCGMRGNAIITKK